MIFPTLTFATFHHSILADCPALDLSQTFLSHGGTTTQNSILNIIFVKHHHISGYINVWGYNPLELLLHDYISYVRVIHCTKKPWPSNLGG